MLLLFILFCSVITQSTQMRPFKNWDVLFNRAVVNWDQPNGQGVVEPVGSVVGVSLYKCLKHCQERLACDLVNYYTVVQVCIFIRHIDKTVPALTEDKNGVAYSSKMDWQTDSVPHPDCHQCNLTDECVVEVDKASCQPTSCGAPPSTDMSTIEGNVFNIGAKLKITCRYDNSIVVYTSCAEDGLWTNAPTTCPDSTTTPARSTSTSTITTSTPTTTSTTTTSTPTSTSATTTSTPTSTSTTTTSTPTSTSTNTTSIPTSTSTTSTPTSTSATTSTTTTPAPPLFSCHSSDNEFRTVSLSDGTTTTYSVRYGGKKKFSRAKSNCNDLNANLLKVTTIAKMQFVLSLTECSGFDDDDLWIDGQKNPDTGVWTTWDGDVIPLTKAFWIHVPEVGEDEYCVRLNRGDGFMMNDRDCGREYYYICER